MQEFINAGINSKKLGIGIDFYGYVWNGVSKPLQNWTTAPKVTANVPYYTIMDKYYSNATTNWDSGAQASYLSINNSTTKQFISFDNEQSIKAKFKYVHNNGLGGIIIWELGGGYRADQPTGKRDLLLQAVKSDWQ